MSEMSGLKRFNRPLPDKLPIQNRSKDKQCIWARGENARTGQCKCIEVGRSEAFEGVGSLVSTAAGGCIRTRLHAETESDVRKISVLVKYCHVVILIERRHEAERRTIAHRGSEEPFIVAPVCDQLYVVSTSKPLCLGSFT